MRFFRDSAVAVGASWSRSPIGYHSRIYYERFESPPAGARFSLEWGFKPAMSNETAGEWQEFAYQDVVRTIRERAGAPDLAAADAASSAARTTLERGKAEIDSILTTFLNDRQDSLIEKLKEQAGAVFAGTQAQFQQAVLPTGQIVSRDMQAITEGPQLAPHLAVQAEVVALKAPFDACGELADIAARAGDHIGRLGRARDVSVQAEGTRVFIGHGGSPLWRELKDFVQDRVAIPWDEFNRVPIAGVTNITRLAEMLDTAAIAFLVFTAEDEQADGSTVARQNVVHEAGLFQGRLGFARAIVLLEEGCEEFSNIEGLGQIRFPKGNIVAAFEEVRRVLEREGIIPY